MDLDDFSGLKKKKKKKKKPFDMEGLEDALTVGFLILSKVNNIIILRQVYHVKVGIIIIVYADVNFTSRFLRMPMRGRQTSSVQICLQVVLRS